ncbi:hypothetical protein FRZ67_12210 [Panacibacter ginsenosidivorans]|uniref:Lipopolysaccharide biosynthesis protein n=1 Tax=Panacibacter ginsenosidivorans TaxID=1813871 RepID=A0A5B8V9U6_9BACT|nr:hypothetical protein [Panacibacter ginsenosidivorans]QEC68029.1 hypothetical protein FRZ67_12210 [Panacibacter ginsenosidivorans]
MEASEKEITLKEFVHKIKESFKFLFSKWLIISIVAAVAAGIGVITAYVISPVYSATVSFVLSNNSSPAGGLMGFATQFGLDLGSNGSDAFSGDNIITLMGSKKMVQEVLLKKPDNKTTLLNTITQNLKLDKKWDETDRTKNMYPFPDAASKMTPIQDSLFREVCKVIQDKMLDVSKPDKDKNIYEVKTTSKNELFAFYFTNYLVDATSSFYIDTKTSTAKRNLDMLQNEADSLRHLLGDVIVTTGAQTDQTFNLNPAYQVQRSGAQQSQVRAAALGEAYGEVLKNLEIAKITLLKETPLYQIIDQPSLPLLIEKPSKLLYLIIGGFIGAFLMMIYLILRKALTSV